MKIKKIKLDKLSYDYIHKVCTTEQCCVIEGTDVVLVHDTNSPQIIAYTRRTYVSGSRLDDSTLHGRLRANGFDYNYGLFETRDVEYLVHQIKSYEEPDSATDNIKRLKKSFRVQKNPEYGVELELESENYMNDETKEAIENFNKKLIEDVGTDSSVINGCEIRFGHPAISGWKYKDVSKILQFCKEKGGETDGGSAGMHIHISRNNIKKITKRFIENLDTMQQILYPINCRNKVMKDGAKITYGVGSNIYRDQTSGFGTLEIRAWNATLDPKLFLARIKFCKTFTDWLDKTTDITIESFFNFMKPEEKRNYKYMLNHAENPHKWGFPAKAINALLA